jgi:hypothetical protein
MLPFQYLFLLHTCSLAHHQLLTNIFPSAHVWDVTVILAAILIIFSQYFCCCWWWWFIGDSIVVTATLLVLRSWYYYDSKALCWALASFSVSWSYTQSVGLLGRGISPLQGLYLYTEQHKQRINARNTDIHALSWIRTHDLSVRGSEYSSCLRPRGHCDRQLTYVIKVKLLLCLIHEDGESTVLRKIGTDLPEYTA